MAQAPAIEAVIRALVERMEGLTPSIRSQVPFRRSSEVISVEATPSKVAFRVFNLDALDGQDDSQEGRGAQLDVSSSDHTARVNITCAYSKGKNERELETLVPSDGDIILRGLARAANWGGTPVLRSLARWRIDRDRAADRWLLVVTLTVQYRDQE